MFAFYSNPLSPESKYAWNKIVSEQMESNPFVNLQGVSLEDPRGMPCDSFNDCVMFHLLTVFPINVAEQEKYCHQCTLQAPAHKCTSVCTLCRSAQCLRRPNAMLLLQPPCQCQHQSENVPFMEAELGANVLHMCPLQWQDQYNMNKKGMTLMDMHLLLTSLESIKCVCTYEKGKSESSKKSSNKGEKGKKCPGTNSTARVPKKVCFEKNCDRCKKHGGAYTTHNTREHCRFEKDGKEKCDFRAAKIDGKKGNPVNHNFAQLSKKIERLEKALKKSGKKSQKHR
jgi:hypothetical protein